jgi:Protein of unknown function (DUF3037)
MTAHYSVLQYLPEPVSGETINVGLVAWNEVHTATRFLRDWKRVQCFSRDHDPKFVEKVCARLGTIASVHDRQSAGEFEIWFRNVVSSWEHCLQFTQPRGSLQDPASLVAELAPLFLHEHTAKQADTRRTRQYAIRIAVKEIRSAVSTVLPEAKRAVSREGNMPGSVEKAHSFDILLTGLRPIAAMNAISFEVGADSELRRLVDASAWVIEDVKNASPNFPVGVFVIPPLQPTVIYQRALGLFPRLHAEVVRPETLQAWASTQAAALAAA